MKRIVSIVVSLSILALIYWKIDVTKLVPVFRNSDGLWMLLSLSMVVPLTLFTSARLQQLMPRRGQLSFGEANKLILVASVLNLVLPSKMGDIAKAYFIKERGHMSGALSLSLVVFEKACDMLSLLWWCVFGLVFIKVADAHAMRAFEPPAVVANALAPLGLEPRDTIFWIVAAVIAGALIFGTSLIGSTTFSTFFFGAARRFAPKKIGAKFASLETAWSEMHGYFWKDKRQLTLVAGTSIFIWFLHLVQIWLFILALKATTPFLANLALSPLAILAGLLPLTFAGVGTRDAALVLFYGPVFMAGGMTLEKAQATAAALGILCTARYLLPALGGAPFAAEYFRLARKMRGRNLADEPAQ